MRIAAIACAAVIGLASGSAAAACNWSTADTAKANDVVASATTPTQAPAQSTPVKLPESDQKG